MSKKTLVENFFAIAAVLFFTVLAILLSPLPEVLRFGAVWSLFLGIVLYLKSLP